VLRSIILIGALAFLQGGPDYYQLAKTAFERGRFEDSLSLLSKLAEGRKPEPAPLNLKAVALSALGRYDEALAANQQAQHLDPDNPSYVYNAGEILIAEGDFSAAEAVFQKGIQRFPSAAPLYRGESQAQFNLNRFVESRQSAKAAVKMAPLDPAGYVTLAGVLYALADRADFGRAASKAVELDPNNYLACYYYGTWLIEDRGKTEEGRDYIIQSVNLNPRFVDGLKAWARIHSREGRWDDALPLYERAMAIDPNDSSLYYLLAVAYRHTGNREKAEWAMREFERTSKR
jgi:Flp pilus assembly protein TadD